MPKEYKHQYNYYLSQLPTAYKEVSTFDKWYKQRTYKNFCRMIANES